MKTLVQLAASRTFRSKLPDYQVSEMLNSRLLLAVHAVYTPHLHLGGRLRVAEFRRQAPNRLTMHKLQAEIERLYAAGPLPPDATVAARQVFHDFRDALTRGEVRAAEKHHGAWRVNAWVKQG